MENVNDEMIIGSTLHQFIRSLLGSMQDNILWTFTEHPNSREKMHPIVLEETLLAQIIPSHTALIGRLAT